jgi:hypothetical protein
LSLTASLSLSFSLRFFSLVDQTNTDLLDLDGDEEADLKSNITGAVMATANISTLADMGVRQKEKERARKRANKRKRERERE